MTMKNDQPKVKKIITPPYLSITKVEEVINLAANRTYNEFTPSLFKSRGFGNADALLAINTLKFLNLIDESGKPTASMSKIGLKGDARKTVFGEIIRAAYGKLFAVVKDPQDLPADELFNEMKTQYDLSPRVVRQAVPVFLKIAEYAGLKEEGTIVGRKRVNAEKVVVKEKTKNQLHSQASNPQTKEAEVVRSGFASTPVADGRIIISMPQEVKEGILNNDATNEDWRILRKAITAFADKHIPKQKADSQEPETG